MFNLVLWQHVVLFKSYAAEIAPGYGCGSCVMLRDTVTQRDIFGVLIKVIQLHHPPP